MISTDHPADAVVRLTLDRPDQRNALSTALLGALHEAVDAIEALDADQHPRAVILTGAGNAFCAGMDLRQVLIDPAHGGSGDPAIAARLLTDLAELTLRLRGLDQVTIAAVNGPAIGGGCGLAASCDVVISHAGAKLGFPEVNLGICPAVVAPWLLRRVPQATARRLLLTGQILSGTEAHRLGLVDQLSADAHAVASDAIERARAFASAGPGALAETRRLLSRLDAPEALELAVRSGAALSAEVLVRPEAQLRLSAFANRDPK